MVTGFRRALAMQADIVVKIDGDGQMPAAIRTMPPLRRFGNVVLGFLAKAATGYWHCSDPTNGFVAIRGDVLAQVPLHRVDPTYFFEISMLGHLYLLGAVVTEEPMPARYQGEPSSLSIPRILVEFPGRLMWSLARRLVLKKRYSRAARPPSLGPSESLE